MMHRECRMTLRLQYPDNLIRRKPFIHRGGAMLLGCNHKRFAAADVPVAQAVQSRCTAAARLSYLTELEQRQSKTMKRKSQERN